MSMRKIFYLAFTFLFITVLSFPQTKHDYPITPVPFTAVHINDNFWLPKIETNMRVSIPAAFRQCQTTGRIDNFAIAGGLKTGEHKGDFPFDDTDVYKVIEGASYSLAIKYDAKLDTYLDSIIAIIQAAQEPDGYLYTARTNKAAKLKRWMGDKRWEKTNSHELYNMGHLYEAAYAHYLATGKRSLLDIALKNAELLIKDFGSKPGQRQSPSGHQIIEMGLAKLYRLTGEEKYINLAKYFIDELGHANDDRKLSGYRQDHKPILEQDEAVGHAVSGAYNFSGIADVAALTGNKEYITAIDRLWENVINKKYYITGGIGQRAWGEGFGPDYELPNTTSYCETCAAIANVYWNYRLFLLHGNAKYIDVLERTLYNGVLSGVSLSGDRYFYDNPLESFGQHERAEWFGCACCPSNITRFIPSIPGYFYAVDKNTVFVNLFAANSARLKLENEEIIISQETDYPWNGKIKIKINSSVKNNVSIKIRIPCWCSGKPTPGNLYDFVDAHSDKINILLNGTPHNINTEKGYITITKEWVEGDVIEVTLPMPVRRITASPAVECNQGKTAFQRGPVVYCFEGIDNPNNHSLNLFIPDSNKIETRFEKDLLNGIVTLNGKCKSTSINEKGEKVSAEGSFKAVPYSVWNNRGKGEMAVWISQDENFAKLIPASSIALRSKCKYSSDEIFGLNDGYDPRNSGDLSVPYFYWWLKTGSEQFVEYEFEKEETINQCDVYWLVKDHYETSYRVPEKWELFYKSGSEWEPVENTTPYFTETDKYNTVLFKPIKTKGLCLRAKLQKDYSAGIIEWKVK